MNDWIEVGKIEDIPRQGARVVRIAEDDIAVFRTLDDEVFALRDKCPHKGGPLSQGIVYGKKSRARYTTGACTSTAGWRWRRTKVAPHRSRSR